MPRCVRRIVNVRVAPIFSACVMLLCPTTAWSQANSATLYGSVTDPAGKVVLSAAVSLIAQDTGIPYGKNTHAARL
jgi:hypothetical protein